MARFQGRVALVTGAASGIGQAIAARFAREGCRVAVVDIDTATGEQTVAAINGQGGQAFFHHADVTDPAQVSAAVQATIQRYSQLDILVNNAGASPRLPVQDMTYDQWQQIVNLNISSMFLFSRAAFPHLKTSPNACVINVASLHAFATVPGMSAYAAAKGGVVAFTRSLALEYGPDKIRVNAIAPGVIETPAWFKSVDDLEAARRHRLRFHPVGRLGRPEDIAGVAAFLAGDDAAFINGVTIPVDGGLSAQLYREQ